MEHWIHMINDIEENYSKYNAFIIVHGTDTMAHTASALSFMIDNLSKPIIITGSQVPIAVSQFCESSCRTLTIIERSQ